MGVLTDDMTRLRTRMDELRQSRKAACADRKDALNDLTRRVRELQANVAQMMDEFRHSRRRTTAQQKADLTAFTVDLTDSVAGMLHDARETMAGSQSARKGTAKEQKAALGVFTSILGDTVGSMLGDFHTARLGMAQDTRDRCVASIGAIRDGVNALRRDVATDLTGVRHAWRGTRPAGRVTVQKRATARPTVEPPPQKQEEPVPQARAKPEPRVSSPDDLTAIHGIGPVMQQRLKAAGILTYAQLAHTTPAELRQRLGKLGRFANVEKWVTDARKLVK